jgi:hypothetical protein
MTYHISGSVQKTQNTKILVVETQQGYSAKITSSPRTKQQKYVLVQSHNAMLMKYQLFYHRQLPRQVQSTDQTLTQLQRYAYDHWPKYAFKWIPNLFPKVGRSGYEYKEPPAITAIISASKYLKWLNDLREDSMSVHAIYEGGIFMSWSVNRVKAELCCYNDGENMLDYRTIGHATHICSSPTKDDLVKFLDWMKSNPIE